MSKLTIKSLPLAAYADMTEGGKLNGDGKKAEIAAICAAKAVETGWLPVQLRTAVYDGPAGKPVDDEADAA